MRPEKQESRRITFAFALVLFRWCLMTSASTAEEAA
jgi:hypothetical protein